MNRCLYLTHNSGQPPSADAYMSLGNSMRCAPCPTAMGCFPILYSATSPARRGIICFAPRLNPGLLSCSTYHIADIQSNTSILLPDFLIPLSQSFNQTKMASALRSLRTALPPLRRTLPAPVFTARAFSVSAARSAGHGPPQLLGPGAKAGEVPNE